MLITAIRLRPATAAAGDVEVFTSLTVLRDLARRVRFLEAEAAAQEKASSAMSSAALMRPGPPPPRNGEDPMKTVAGKLGLSTDDLKSQLDSGKSLNDVAEAQGVSHDDLISAIKAGLPTHPVDAVSGTSAVDVTQIAEQIAATQGRPQGRRPDRRRAAPRVNWQGSARTRASWSRSAPCSTPTPSRSAP